MMIKLLTPKLKWKTYNMDVHKVLDNWTWTHPFFEKHILPHETFEKFLITEETKRICLESNTVLAKKTTLHCLNIDVKKLNENITQLILFITLKSSVIQYFVISPLQSMTI